MSTAAQPDDLVHDEYLRAALRHAPDHGLTPPSSITQHILAAARQVHRPVRPAAAPAPVRATIAARSRWRDVLRFLGSPRWAGGFASGLVAALVVGLWIDSELPRPVAPAPEASTGVAGRDTPQPSPAAGSTDESRAAGAAAPVARDTAAAVSTPAPARKPDPPAPAAPLVKQPGDAAAQGRGPAGREAEAASDTVAPAERGAAPAARSAPTPALRAEAAADDARLDALGKAATAGGPQPSAPLPKTEPVPGAEGTARAAASPALTLLRRMRAESAAQSASWTWQPPGATVPRPVDADGEAWLLRLLQAARGRWVDVAVPSDAGSADEVRWWRDGEPHARLRIEAGGLRWIEASGRIRFAPLEPPALERLRSH